MRNGFLDTPPDNSLGQEGGGLCHSSGEAGGVWTGRYSFCGPFGPATRGQSLSLYTYISLYYAIEDKEGGGRGGGKTAFYLTNQPVLLLAINAAVAVSDVVTSVVVYYVNSSAVVLRVSSFASIDRSVYPHPSLRTGWLFRTVCQTSAGWLPGQCMHGLSKAV
eukprot:GHVU01061149.1.p1 GENE.GHVU01061149.1~~GHVU01061149.1.p1  ORF type:complete len:163 (+),score=2.94 GHVU01061149.1:52-540(+)